MPGPSTRLILGSDLEYHRRLDGLTPGEENSIVSRRTKIENRQVAHVLLYSLLTVEDAWMRYGRVPHEFANELWPLARPREPT